MVLKHLGHNTARAGKGSMCALLNGWWLCGDGCRWVVKGLRDAKLRCTTTLGDSTHTPSCQLPVPLSADRHSVAEPQPRTHMQVKGRLEKLTSDSVNAPYSAALLLDLLCAAAATRKVDGELCVSRTARPAAPFCCDTTVSLSTAGHDRSR